MHKSFDAELSCLAFALKVCGHNQLLAAVAAQRWYRQTCSITIPKVGALALRLRSSDIQTTHITTRSTRGENTQRDKVKHISKLTSAKYKTKGGRYNRHMHHTQHWIHREIRITNSLLIPLSQKKKCRSLVERVKQHLSHFSAGRSPAMWLTQAPVGWQVSGQQFYRWKHWNLDNIGNSFKSTEPCCRWPTFQSFMTATRTPSR